jgi:hypothetical protein
MGTMRLKPYTIKPPAIKRIDIKIAEYDGKDYKGRAILSEPVCCGGAL